MKYVFLISIFLLVGCGGNSANKLLNTGKKPPTFFTISDKKTMDNFVFNTQKFSFIFPSTKKSDFTGIRKGWSGMSSRDGHSISFGFKVGSVYFIDISTSYKVSEYDERERAVDAQSIAYIQKIKKKYQYPNSTKLYYGIYGKEGESCIIKERVDKFNRHKISYDCYKFNPNKTKARSVTIVLTYNKPKNPTLAKQYTYNDLKRRAKRMLDSLYIKDGW